MKIGILTLPIAENYGGILQAVALYQYFANEGHEVTLIYKENQKNILKEVIKKTLILIPFHNLFNVRTNAQINMGLQERIALHKNFIDQEIPSISPYFITTDELRIYAEEQQFDIVIVGSDQVWRKAYINDPYYFSYFLDFVPESTKKASYAASFGKDHWEGSGDEQRISELLKKFSGISVRETSGVDICQKTFGIDNVQHVLDPTLLMGKEFYLELIKKYDVSNISPQKIVTYVLDEADKKKEITQFYQNELCYGEDEILHLKGFSDANRTYSVPEWLSAIANADFVITDSFHGMVFSIIFEKQFIVIGNRDRGYDRFVSLLSSLSLENYLIDSNSMSSEFLSIDYKRINTRLENLKEASSRFLYNHTIG